MKERKHNPDLLTCLPEPVDVDELSELLIAKAAAINAYCGQDVTPALNHFAAEDPIPYKELSDIDRYPVIKFNNFSVSCVETDGPEGKKIYVIDPRQLVENLIRAIESVDKALGLDPYMNINWRPLLALFSIKHFTFDVFAIPLIDLVYLCPALRWDRQVTSVTPEQIEQLVEIIRGDTD